MSKPPVEALFAQAKGNPTGFLSFYLKLKPQLGFYKERLIWAERLFVCPF